MEEVEFKAGRCTREGNTVTPLAEKGVVKMKLNDDELVHLTWTSTETNKTEIDLILFPGDAVFQKLDIVKDGRVFLLKFTSTPQRQFFWMQDPNVEKDAEVLKKINGYLNEDMDTKNDKPATTTPVVTKPKEEPKKEEPKKEEPKPVVQQNNPPPQNTTTRPPQTQSTPQYRPPQQQGGLGFNLQNILQNMNIPKKTNAGPNLSSILDDKIVTKILLEDKEAQSRILPFLPPGDQNIQGIQELLTSPQFLQAADTLHHAMAKGHLTSIAKQCGVDPNKLPQRDSMIESFFAGLEESAQKSKPSTSSNNTNENNNNDNQKKDDDNMDDDEMDEETRKAIEMSLLDDN